MPGKAPGFARADVPGIHGLSFAPFRLHWDGGPTWIAGSSPAMTKAAL